MSRPNWCGMHEKAHTRVNNADRNAATSLKWGAYAIVMATILTLVGLAIYLTSHG